MLNLLRLTVLFVVSVITVSANAQTEVAPAIKLERTACFGTCPVYAVTIFENGIVGYRGENCVEVTEEQISEIDPETVGQPVVS